MKFIIVPLWIYRICYFEIKIELLVKLVSVWAGSGMSVCVVGRVGLFLVFSLGGCRFFCYSSQQRQTCFWLVPTVALFWLLFRLFSAILTFRLVLICLFLVEYFFYSNFGILIIITTYGQPLDILIQLSIVVYWN
jgi:hypothetical protein